MNNIGIIIGNISSPSGTERAVTNLANLLQPLVGYNVFIISMYSKNNDKCFYQLEPGVQINHLDLPNGNIILRILSYIILPFKISEICKKNNLNFILGTGHQTNSLMALAKTKAKKIACEHMNYYSCPFYSRFARRVFYSFLDGVVCLTKKDTEKYRFLKKTKLFTIPNSLSFISLEQASLENKSIICVGRLTKQKGWDYLISAAHKLKERIPDWHINLFGNGEEKEKLMELIEEYNVDDFITIYDPVKNIRDKFLESGIMCETSRWEGFSLVLAEAQECGLPLVGFDCPEGPGDIIIEGECGYLVPVGDIENLVNRIIDIATNKELQISMGKKSKALAQRYKTEEIRKQWISLFEYF